MIELILIFYVRYVKCMKFKRLFVSSLILIMMMSVYGCGNVELTEEEEQLVVDYSVNAVINHDKNYGLKLMDVEIESETETVWKSEKDTTSSEKNTEGSSNEQDQTTAFAVETDMNTVLRLSGIDVSYKSYKMCETYPEGESLNFVMNAVDGSNLIVIELNVKNTTDKDIKLDMLNSDIKFKGIFNSQVRANCQTTMLNNAFNTYNGTIKANETKEMVLVFEASRKNLKSVSTIKLEISNGDITETVILKK